MGKGRPEKDRMGGKGMEVTAGPRVESCKESGVRALGFRVDVQEESWGGGMFLYLRILSDRR